MKQSAFFKSQHAFSCLAGFCLSTAATLAAAGPLVSAVTSADLQPSSYAQWVDGKEEPLSAPMDEVVWVKPPRKGHGIEFGESKTPGVRHLRIGFSKPVEVGSVLVEG